MSEYEYFTNSPYTNFCKEMGYYKRLEDQAHIHRVAAFRIHQSFLGKNAIKNIDDFWQIGEKKKVEIPKMTVEEWQKIKEIHGVV
jgi:hypothetical protein